MPPWPRRERYSDPDASWGHRSAVSTRKGGGFYGYKVHAAVCALTGLPLAWTVETARDAELPARAAGYARGILLLAVDDFGLGKGWRPDLRRRHRGDQVTAEAPYVSELDLTAAQRPW